MRANGSEAINDRFHLVLDSGGKKLFVDATSKGSQVYVEGSLRTRKWTDQSGVEKYSTEIRADQMQMLGSRQGMGQPAGDDGGGYDSAPRRPAPASRQAPASAPAQRPAAPASKASSGFDDMDDDIPF